MYKSSDDPLYKEQQEEVDRISEEARNIDNEIEDTEKQEESDEMSDHSDDIELDTEEARRYREITAGLNYLAVDRIDFQYSVKGRRDICRHRERAAGSF